ncbi:MAG: ABC transporter permease [Longimicrobiales bacterium]
MRKEPTRQRWASIFRRSPDSEVGDELAYHLEERVRENIASGMHPDAARAAALERLGDLDHVRKACSDMLASERRTEMRRAWLKLSWLDFKLGFRMLTRYPGLTVVGGLAMAFAIWIGAGTFELVTQLVDPALPLPGGDRVVGVWNWDATSADNEEPTLHDFALWRAELEAVDELGAFRNVERNLIIGDGAGTPVQVAEITASAFDVARVPPLLGRRLVEADERRGASEVVVIGYEVWQDRFESDPTIIGRTVRLDHAQTVIVGVMPAGFAFPVNHDLWTPLRLDVLAHERAESPRVQVFGRLAPGATLESAQAELATLGRRAATDFPETHEHLRPEVMAYTAALFPIGDMTASGDMYWFNIVGVMLMLLMCCNVALLMFARAAARESELVVRNALGASRGRIITQLFTEALVLGGVATVIGLAAAGQGLEWAYRLLELNAIQLPFWFDVTLSPETVLYAGALTVFGALVAGVVPALKVTGKALDARLRQASAGGGGFHFGGVWTAVIVAQLAATLAFPVPAFFLLRWSAQIETADVGFAEEEFLSARLEMDLPATRLELERRLLAEPGVLGVTFAERLPRMFHRERLIEIDGNAPPPDSGALGYVVKSTSVAPGFFDVLGTRILAGRGFEPADVESGRRVAIVNESFVRHVLGGRNAIGRRVRDVAGVAEDGSSPEPGPWHEIIGVVPDLAIGNLSPVDDGPDRFAGFYEPLPSGAAGGYVVVRVRGDPGTFTQRLRVLAAAVDPSLRLYEVTPLADASEEMVEFLGLFLRIVLIASGVALLLSLTGIYAVMAFTVAQRTREIGIRIALGADRRRLALAVFRRPLKQVGLGILVGAALVAIMAPGALGDMSAGAAALLLTYVAFMMVVCMIACVVPTRRALAVEPTEALRADG